jgi:hypothetical protein
MIIPYKPITNELVANRIDFIFDHARKLDDASQVVNPSSNAQMLTLKPSPEPIAMTLCSTLTYFPGDEGKYDNRVPACAKATPTAAQASGATQGCTPRSTPAGQGSTRASPAATLGPPATTTNASQASALGSRNRRASIQVGGRHLKKALI